MTMRLPGRLSWVCLSSEDLMTKQRHHYIPRFYLKNFADPANQKIWLYNKTG